MKTRFLRLLPFCALLLALTSIPTASRAQVAPGDGRPDQTVLRLTQGALHTQTADGGYTSLPTEAVRAFTHVLVRHVASVPAGASFALAIRVSRDGANWTDWHTLSINDDLWVEADGPDVRWSDNLDVGEARFWQVRATAAPAPDGTLPALRQVDVNTVDTRTFQPAGGDAPPLATQGAPQSATSKPGVVSRTGWGNPDGQGSRVRPAHYPANHITIHHTADSSSLRAGEANWAARVRAEWSFHTFTRGWGDIGYNFLIDPNGVIYEGRAGGDDAVGFHDTANYGSVGVSVIGTYVNAPPTVASQNSLVRLLAWKVNQKDIDPLGRSYYYGCATSKLCAPYNPGGVVANIAGHRQVTPGHTTCPGDAFMALLPGLKNRVKAMLTADAPPTDNGDLEIDELETSFARSPAQWFEAACGEGGHTYYTYTTDDQAESTNSATWRPNLPQTGNYRVYAHIPQRCGLGDPPYASERAQYRIRTSNGDVVREVNQNTNNEWVDLGRYRFTAGQDGAVELYDLTGEPYRDQKVLFFDAIKWVRESNTTDVQISDVRYDNTTLASGELLRVTFTVKNTGDEAVRGQAPQPPQPFRAASKDGTVNDGYAYDQYECFNSDEQGSYPAFPKESNRFRVALGPADENGIACAGGFGGYPWRWGISGELAPGDTQQVVGYVRFREPGSYTLRAGMVQEYVNYFAQDVQPTTITVTDEQVTPDAVAYDQTFTPLARVYKLGSIPDNFLARTINPHSILRGAYVGSFAWNGSFTDWGENGPLGMSDQYLVEQTRSFHAPVAGEYVFRTTTDDGSWLWVDGQLVVTNGGLHTSKEVTGRIQLDEGVHTLAFRYFDRDGLASAGYAMQMPDTQRARNVPTTSDDPGVASTNFGALPDAMSNALRFGATFIEQPTLTIVADDHGGTGVATMRWSLNGGAWQENDGALLRLDRNNFPNGEHYLRYYAVDNVGNVGDTRELTFTVNTELEVSRLYLPLTGR